MPRQIVALSLLVFAPPAPPSRDMPGFVRVRYRAFSARFTTAALLGRGALHNEGAHGTGVGLTVGRL
ncbi:hypothetical protein OJ604_11865, partial [Streptococcus anginosus]|nr:hypothetical protein [Streptococcus anginosus]